MNGVKIIIDESMNGEGKVNITLKYQYENGLYETTFEEICKELGFDYIIPDNVANLISYTDDISIKEIKIWRKK